MSLKTLVQSLERKEALLPALRAFLREEREQQLAGKISHVDIVKEDSRLSIIAFKDRLKEYNHRDDLDGDYFHPSRLGTCLRQLYFEAKRAPRDPQKDVDDIWREHMIFESGTYVGVMFANLCERAGILTRREVAIVSSKEKVIGHADVEVTLKGLTYVVEVKTINSRQFTLLKQPHESHKRQVHAYMKCLQRKLGIIVYLEKDRHAAKEFVIPFNQAYYDTYVRDRIDTYFRAVKRHVIPEREGINPNTMPCRFCPFTNVCFGTRELNTWLKKLRMTKLKIRPMVPVVE